MEQEREDQLFRLQADFSQALADPIRLKLLTLLGKRPRAVKDLVVATGERQTKISQHLAIMRQRGIVRTQRIGTEIHYSLANPRILEACRITREVLLEQLTRQASLAVPPALSKESKIEAMTTERENDDHTLWFWYDHTSAL